MSTWMDTAIKILAIPGVAEGLLALILALLMKSKILTEKDISTAKNLAHTMEGNIHEVASKVTDVTGLTLPQAKAIVADVKEQTAGGDGNQKKIQRAFRAVVRGWLKF